MNKVDFITELLLGSGSVSLGSDLQFTNKQESTYHLRTNGSEILLDLKGCTIPFSNVYNALMYVSKTIHFKSIDLYDLDDGVNKLTPFGDVEFEDGVYRLHQGNHSRYLGDNVDEAIDTLSLLAFT